MKKLLLLFAALCCTIVANAANEVAKVTVNDIDYALYDDNTAILTNGKSAKGDIVLPSVITHEGKAYALTALKDGAFVRNKNITAVVIPNSVSAIGESCFNLCSELTSVTIPNSVTAIGASCFSDCSELASVTIPNSVTAIGASCFSDCSELASVTIPNSVTTIEDFAFTCCEKLTSVTIPNSVSTIGISAFMGCSSLKSVAIGAFVQSIGEEAFSQCNIGEMTFYPTQVPSLGSSAIPTYEITIFCMDHQAYESAKSSFGGVFPYPVISGFRPGEFQNYYNSVIEAIDLAADRNGLSTEEKSAINGYKTAISNGNDVAKNELAAHRVIVLARIKPAEPGDGLYEEKQAVVNSKITSINSAGSLATIYTAQEEFLYTISALDAIEEAMQGYSNSKFLKYLVKEQLDAIISTTDIGTIDSNRDTAVKKLKDVIDIYITDKAETLGTLGTPQNGPAVKVTDKDGKEIILYAPKSVEYIKVGNLEN